MMDILYFIPKTNLDDKINGAIVHPVEVVKNMCKNNKIHVVCQKKIPYANKNLKFYELKVNIPHIGNILLSYLGFIRALIISPKVDVIYIRNDYFFGASYFLSLFTKKPKIIEVNGILEDEIGDKKTKLTLLEFYFNARACRLASKIVVVTAKIGKELTKMYNINPQKIVVIENGANTDLFKPADQKEARKKLGLDHDAIYVCFVGNLAQWQGVEYLILSAPLILKDKTRTKFLIVGEGVMKEELINLAGKTGVSDKFVFTGIVPYEEVPKYINASDVCVVPKRPLKSGYSPLKLYEYMACGKPVVASRVEGFTILEQNNAGILVEPENPEKLANVILKLLKDEKLREELGRNGREYVVKYHSWANVAKNVAEVCEDAVREHKNKNRCSIWKWKKRT